MLTKRTVLTLLPTTRRLVAGLVLLYLGNGLAGATSNQGNEVLAQLPGSAITRAEFEVSQRAWRDRYPAERLSSLDFLNLLVRLRQLALVARDRDLHRDPEFRMKLSELIAGALETGLLRRDIENRKLREAYDRQQYVVHASQLLIALPGQTGNSRVAALRKISRLRDKLISGQASFADLARRESDDPTAPENAGRLGYFSVFDQVYPLENAAYATPVGEISAPVESRFGYHLVRVNSRQRISGLKRASHILIRHETGDARGEIERLRRALTPDNFAELATRHSQDYKTRARGGDLGTDRLVDSLEAVKLTLPVGAVSTTFRSALGWHLLKITAEETFPRFMQSRPQLRKKLKHDDRVGREIASITAAADPTTIDSTVIESYIDDSLCRLILNRLNGTTLAVDGSRNLLIMQLKELRLTPTLQQQLLRYPPIIDHALLHLIGN